MKFVLGTAYSVPKDGKPLIEWDPLAGMKENLYMPCRMKTTMSIQP